MVRWRVLLAVLVRCGAVGSACAVNRLPVVVPCHRVVGSGGGLGGYAYGLDAKRRLLATERAATGGDGDGEG